MANNYFQFKQFTIYQDQCAMKVGTDGVLLGAWVNIERVNRVLDVGTGTGLIALMIAQRCNASINAIEIDQQAFSQAVENCNASPWSSRIKLIHSSLQEYTLQDKRYDLIVCNPPFFSKSLKASSASRTLARHNHSLSLPEFFGAALQLLSPSGRFAFIYPSLEENAIMEQVATHGLYINKLCRVKPTPQKKAHRIMLEISAIQTSYTETELIIEQYGRHGYSKEYLNLTQEFYL